MPRKVAMWPKGSCYRHGSSWGPVMVRILKITSLLATPVHEERFPMRIHPFLPTCLERQSNNPEDQNQLLRIKRAGIRTLIDHCWLKKTVTLRMICSPVTEAEIFWQELQPSKEIEENTNTDLRFRKMSPGSQDERP